MDELKSSCNDWKPFIAMISIEFAFAVTNIFFKKVLEERMSDLVFITYSLTIATIFLSPTAYFWERNSRPKLTIRILCYLLFSTIVGTSLTQYFFLLGIQCTSAAFASAFINMVPVITFTMALPYEFETANIRQNSGKAKVIGTLVCIGGAMVLTLYRGIPLFKDSHNQAETSTRDMQMHSTRRNDRWTIGTIAFTVGILLWSSWFLIQSYELFYVDSERENRILSVLYAGIVGTGLCFLGLSWCVKKKGPVFTAAFNPLVQIMAATFDIPLLHEGLHLGSLLGSITVIIGLYILLWGKKKEMQNCASKASQEAEDNEEQEPQQLQGIGVVSSASNSP